VNSIVIIVGNDWEIWYVNGKLQFSGHAMDREEILTLTQALEEFTFSEIYTHQIFSDGQRMGNFDRPTPKTLIDFESKLTDQELAKYLSVRIS
jgi:hypothetical protein